MITLQEIDATEHVADMAWMLPGHREELTTNKDLMHIKPDMETYAALQGLGKLLSVAASDGDRMVGYSINIIQPMLHYADVLTCQNDLLYLHPDYRKGSTGLRLMRETERLARDRGCQMMTWHAKFETPLFAILEKLRYRKQEAVYSRVL
jgi:GNAT superfamily N-acetyltransferase